MLIDFDGNTPNIDASAVVTDGAKIIGDVTIGKHSNIWFNSVLRGDLSSITIGEYSNVQDCSVVHGDSNSKVTIGDHVTIGHSAVVHGCTIENNCLIGMGAVVLDDAVIGENSIVGANALVTSKTVIPPNSLVLGSPAKVVKQIDVKDNNVSHATKYAELAKMYK